MLYSPLLLLHFHLLPLISSLFLSLSLLTLIFFLLLLTLLKCLSNKDTLKAEKLGHPSVLLTQKVQTLVLLPPLLLLGYSYFKPT
jgi:hypothetical protein